MGLPSPVNPLMTAPQGALETQAACTKKPNLTTDTLDRAYLDLKLRYLEASWQEPGLRELKGNWKQQNRMTRALHALRPQMCAMWGILISTMLRSVSGRKETTMTIGGGRHCACCVIVKRFRDNSMDLRGLAGGCSLILAVYCSPVSAEILSLWLLYGASEENGLAGRVPRGCCIFSRCLLGT